MNVEKKVKAFIEKQGLIKKGDRVLLGLSGGADSVCLFYLLLGLREELGFTLRAAHIHHGIRREADEDAAYVRSLCEKKGILCYVFREDVPAYAKRYGLGEEEAGREIRYREFEKSLKIWQAEEEEAGLQSGSCGQICPPCFKIATAHHENDQAETVVFQLFRGCGLAGLRGILPKREQIIRPILCLSRAEIESYLREKGIVWCEDRTNQSEDYSRNKIRHQILSYAEKEISHDAPAHIAKTAEIVREAEDYIKRQVKAAYQKTAAEQENFVVFDILSLQQEDIFLQKQLLLYGFERILAARKDIGAVHIEDVLKLMEKAGNGELFMPGGVRVQKYYQKLALFQKGPEDETDMLSELLLEDEGFLYGETKPEIEMEQIDLTEEEAVKKRFGIQDVSEIVHCIPEKTYTKWFDYDKIKMPFSIRHWEKEDYLTIDGSMNRKTFRRYMIENKIPAPRRAQIWLLADASHVIWVPGGRISAYYKVTKQTKTILQVKICM